MSATTATSPLKLTGTASEPIAPQKPKRRPTPRDALRAGSYTRFPDWLMVRTDIDNNDKAVWARLVDHMRGKGFSNPSVERLRKESGLKADGTVRKAIRALAAAGLLRIEPVAGRRTRYWPKAPAGVDLNPFKSLKKTGRKQDTTPSNLEGAKESLPPQSLMPTPSNLEGVPLKVCGTTPSNFDANPEGVNPEDCARGSNPEEISCPDKPGQPAPPATEPNRFPDETSKPKAEPAKKARRALKNEPPAVIRDIYDAYPKHEAPRRAFKAIAKAISCIAAERKVDLAGAAAWLLEQVQTYAKTRIGQDEQFTPHPATWFNDGRYAADSAWRKSAATAAGPGAPAATPAADPNRERIRAENKPREAEAQRRAAFLKSQPRDLVDAARRAVLASPLVASAPPALRKRLAEAPDTDPLLQGYVYDQLTGAAQKPQETPNVRN